MKSLNKLNLERIWLQRKDFSKRWRLKIYLKDSKKRKLHQRVEKYQHKSGPKRN